MQRIGQFIFDFPRHSLPVIGVGQPVRPVGDEGPGADLRDPARQRVDIAGDAVGLVDLGAEPGVGNPALFASGIRTAWSRVRHARPAQSCGNPGSGRRPTAVPRRPCHAPCRAHRRRARRDRARAGLRRSARGSAPHAVGASASDTCKRAERGEIQFRIAPLQHFHAARRCGSAARSPVPARTARSAPWCRTCRSRVARPARPAICANSAGFSLRN